MAGESGGRSRNTTEVRRRGLLLVVLAAVVVASSTGLASVRDRDEPAASDRVGQHQVWQLPRIAIGDLQGCAEPVRRECVRKVMERHGASAEAFEFYCRTGWFLTKLKETGGPVRLASVVNPWRANENEQPALVGGNPAVVYPEEAAVSVDDDAAFKALKKRFPQVILWAPGPALEKSTTTAGGQSFVFRYRLLNGCHACAVLGRARVEFDFAPDGTFRGAKLLNVDRKKV
jgi:hypothetical protein